MIYKIYYAIFDGCNFMHHNGAALVHTVNLKRIMTVDGKLIQECMKLPAWSCVQKALPYIEQGDNVIFRLRREEGAKAPILDSFYIIPAWAKDTSEKEWNVILDDLNKNK